MTFRDRPLTVWGPSLVMLLLALTVLGSDAFGLASSLRGALFDAYTRSAPRPFEDPAGHPVRVLDIDSAAIAQLGTWPWPHATLAGVIDALKRDGAAAVVVVGRVDRPDPLSGRALSGLVPPGPNYEAARKVLTELPSPDTALATAMRGVPTITGLDLSPTADGQPPRLKADVHWNGTRSPLARLPAFASADGSLAPIETASAGLGALALSPERDGHVRRMPLAFLVGATVVPSLDAEVLRLIEARPQLTLRSDDGNSGFFGGTAGIAALETAGGTLATSANGSLWLYLSGPNPRRMIAASALMREELKPDALRGAIVYIGNPAALVATATGPRAVAELHAEAAENLLLGSALRRPTAAVQAELLCLVLFGIGCALLIARLGIAAAAGYVVLISAGAGYVSWRLYAGEHVLFDALGLGAGLWLIWATGALARSFEMWRTRSTLRRAFTDVLPKRVINTIARQPAPMKLEGETRTVTYLACGVRGFSDLASSFRGDPAAFTRLIQRVLDPLMAQALEHEGAIGKLTPDGFTAFWNAPLDDPEHAVRACEAAMGMMEAIAHINEIIIHERRIDGVALDPVEIGVGISSGPAIAGGFEVHGRKVYSVNGDCAVTAARVQQLSGQYGPAVVVSEETRKLAERGFAFLEVDYIALEHQEDPVKLYAMLGNPVMRASPKFRALATFHDHIFQSMRDQQWHKARALIAQCRKLSGASQKLYDMHLARIAYFQENPPGADWDGAFRQILH